LSLAANRFFNQLCESGAGQRCKNDRLHCRSSFANRLEFAHQWMGGIDFVVSISTNQHQVPQIRLSQKILEHIECCQIEPLQVVEEESKRMLRSCEYADEAPKDELKAALRVLWRKNRDRRLFSDDKFQFGNQVGDK